MYPDHMINQKPADLYLQCYKKRITPGPSEGLNFPLHLLHFYFVCALSSLA